MARGQWDIIVIGGGPAGSSAARHAAQAGARVLLLEKRPMPRPKLCGGWVSQQALSLLDFRLPSDRIAHTFDRLELCVDRQRNAHEPKSALGVFVDRAVFDAYLVEVAQDCGVAVQFESVRQIAANGTAVHVTTDSDTYESGGAIICTGADGDLVESVRPKDPPEWTGVCIEQSISRQFEDVLCIRPGAARLMFGRIRHGFGWILHHGESLLIGVGGRRSNGFDVRSAYSDFWASLRLPANLIRFKGHLIPIGGLSRPIGRGRILLAGDTAGTVDAFTGEGIAMAICSGQIAATTLGESTPAPALSYARKFDRAIGGMLRQSLWVSRVFHRLPSQWQHRVLMNPKTPSLFQNVLDGVSGYRTFLTRLALLQMASVVRRRTLKSPLGVGLDCSASPDTNKEEAGWPAESPAN